MLDDLIDRPEGRVNYSAEGILRGRIATFSTQLRGMLNADDVSFDNFCHVFFELINLIVDGEEKGYFNPKRDRQTFLTNLFDRFEQGDFGKNLVFFIQQFRPNQEQIDRILDEVYGCLDIEIFADAVRTSSPVVHEKEAVEMPSLEIAADEAASVKAVIEKTLSVTEAVQKYKWPIRRSWSSVRHPIQFLPGLSKRSPVFPIQSVARNRLRRAVTDYCSDDFDLLNKVRGLDVKLTRWVRDDVRKKARMVKIKSQRRAGGGAHRI